MASSSFSTRQKHLMLALAYWAGRSVRSFVVVPGDTTSIARCTSDGWNTRLPEVTTARDTTRTSGSGTVVPRGGGGHHKDFTVQQLETGVNCLDQPGQVCRREATGRRRWQQDHLPVDR